MGRLEGLSVRASPLCSTARAKFVDWFDSWLLRMITNAASRRVANSERDELRHDLDILQHQLQVLRPELSGSVGKWSAASPSFFLRAMISDCRVFYSIYYTICRTLLFSILIILYSTLLY